MANLSSTTMDDPSPTSVDAPSTALQELTEFINTNHLSDAEDLVVQGDMEQATDDATLLQVGNLRLKQRRWQDAEAIFSRISDAQAEAALQLQLTRNLATVEDHHPELLPSLLDNPPCTQCRIIRTSAGEFTIAQRPVAGRWISLTKGDSADLAFRNHLEAMADRTEKGSCIALCGLGDGHLLMHLATHSPDLFLDREQAIFILEPHPEVLLHNLMIHDMTGERSPLTQRRFQWCVGPDWAEQAESHLRKNIYLPYPEHYLALSMLGSMMENRINRLAENLIAWEEEMIETVKNQYGKRTPDEWSAPFRKNPSRPPRAMLITSRYTTVLQYSTKDIASGLREEDWQTEIIIENEPHEMISNRALLTTMRDFDPDIIIQIDHLRSERAKLYPTNIPFVCWIQDELPNLTNRKAGQSVGLRDFVLTCAQPTYTRKYGYPKRQILFLEKLTRGVAKETQGCGDGPPDIVFVSNASQIPQLALRRVAEDFAEVDGLQEIIQASGEQMIAVYQNGGCIITTPEIKAIIEDETNKRGGCWKSSEHLDKLAIRMSGILNNALYRQQALDWIVEVVDEMNLSLELYGQGWEDNPKYARFAKGYIQYGQPLEELTRRAKINLQIIPYSCLHQRLLDGLMAGGFFLLREQPFDQHFQAIDQFMTENAIPDLPDIKQARQSWSTDVTNEYNRINQYYKTMAEDENADLVEAWHDYSSQGLHHVLQRLPHLSEVSFSDKESFARCIHRFLNDQPCREEIRREQRQFVMDHYTYRGNFKRIMRRIGHLIETENPSAQELAD